MEKYLTVKEVAEMFGVCMGAVYKLIKDGKLKAFRMGGIKIKQSELDRYINGGNESERD